MPADRPPLDPATLRWVADEMDREARGAQSGARAASEIAAGFGPDGWVGEGVAPGPAAVSRHDAQRSGRQTGQRKGGRYPAAV